LNADEQIGPPNTRKARKGDKPLTCIYFRVLRVFGGKINLMFSCQIDENLKLVLPLPWHAEEIASLVRENLDILKPWMPWATDDYSTASAREYIGNALRDLSENGTFSANIVWRENIAGSIGCHHYDANNKSVMIGYWLGKKAQGKGIVTKCCRRLIDYAFDEIHLNRVQINCNVENIKSRAIPERLGFRLEGIHRQVEFHNGRFGDWAIYAMLREDWRKSDR
jgi:ribosomal-protein-serine acetyltransferase